MENLTALVDDVPTEGGMRRSRDFVSESTVSIEAVHEGKKKNERNKKKINNNIYRYE